MMNQFMKTYAPMTGTGPGAILAAASAQDIMSYSGMKSLQTLNSALDSVSQIIMGGASGAAAQYAAGQGLAGAVTPKKGQSVAAAIAQALKASPFSAQGAAAWSAFTTGTANAPGAISTLQSEGDQLRTYLTLGALNSGAGRVAGRVRGPAVPAGRAGLPDGDGDAGAAGRGGRRTRGGLLQLQAEPGAELREPCRRRSPGTASPVSMRRACSPRARSRPRTFPRWPRA